MLTKEVVRELLDYNPKTGELFWRSRDRIWFNSDRSWKNFNNRDAGNRAGSIQTGKTNYTTRVVTLNGKIYREHNIIWLYVTGCWPTNQIDHINRNATDNRWCNLRESNYSQNNKNISKRSDNKSGVTGVYWDNGCNKWRAQVRINGKIHYLGSFNEEDLDIAAMEVMEFRIDNGFDPMHGLSVAHYRKD